MLPNTVLTIAQAVTLGLVLDACQRQVPVTWENERGDLLTGTMRSLEVGRGQDVREARVRISATFEHWFPIAQVCEMVDSGSMALDYRA